jgi:adenylosuccinate lyase
MVDALNAVMTAQSQWLERTLDDSANRRVSLPEGFLCCDSILRIAKNVTSGLVVNEKVIEKTLKDYMPFIATENIMMEAVKRGGDRQKIHEIIRKCSMEATKAMKEGRDGGLIKRLLGEEQIGLTHEELEIIMDPSKYTGRCAEQVEKYVEHLTPLIGDAEAEDEDLDI